MTGRSIGHYEIIAKIGEGGMGAVFKARDTRLNRIVAIKTLSAATPERKARFLQEAQAASALNHPNIVTVHDFLNDGGQDYIVMEFVPGKTLDHAIPSHGFRFDEALKIAIQIAAALTRAHEAGIVHRDVKPSNIIVRDDGTVKVLDFGLAKLTEPILASGDDATRTARPATEEGTIVGTVSYMSPEQAEGRPVDARSDIFSFGSVLFEMLTGRRAFHGSSKLSTLSSILKEDPKPPSQTGANVPRDLERVLFRCLRKDAERRYQLMKEVRLALEELKEESDSGHLTGAAAPIRPRSRLAVYLSLAAGVLAVAGAALWYRSQSVPKPPSELTLRQLTQDAGYTGDPSISPDGKLVAYASDRAGGVNLDIWVQQIAAGSQPIRLTKDPADDFGPSFSPDGGQIAFLSRREGGGVFLIPALGGEERVVLRGLYYSVAFSPDGQSIAASRDPFATRLFVVPAAGGTPTQIAPDFYSALVAAWSPDGKKLLFRGAKKQGDRPDLWLADVRGGSTIRLDTGAIFAGRVSGQQPGAASWKGDYLHYALGNLFRVKVDSASARFLGPPERLTRGSGNEGQPSAAPYSSPSGWRIVFTNRQSTQQHLYRIPLDPKSGKQEPIFQDGISRTTPSLSRDGSKLGYIARGVEGFQLRVRDMKTGGERMLLQQKNDLRARVSPDGSVVAFNLTATNEGDPGIYLVPSNGGASRKACGECGLIYDWAPDGKRIVYRTGVPMRFETFDIASGAKAAILSHPRYHVHAAKYSADMRWLAFHLAPGDGPSHIFIVPARDGNPPPESEWIPVYTRPGYNNRPFWSADGNTLYFLSDSEGAVALFAQRLDPATKRTRGDPVPVFRPAGQYFFGLAGHYLGPGEGPGYAVIPLTRNQANVWLAE